MVPFGNARYRCVCVNVSDRGKYALAQLLRQRRWLGLGHLVIHLELLAFACVLFFDSKRKMSSVSESQYPFVERALHFFGVERNGATGSQRCKQLLEVLANRGLDVPTFLTSVGGVAGLGQPLLPSDCEELSFDGYREMQLMRQAPGYDTINDLDETTIFSVSSLYDAVIGKAMRQESVMGTLETGKLTLTGLTSQSWNERNNKGARFGHHDEVWHVRSHPKGRIGQKLVPGEIRKVTVLVRSIQQKVGRISTMRLQLLPPATSTCRPDVNRGQATYGALGVPAMGIHLWERRDRVDRSEDCFHVVYGGFVLLVRSVEQGLLPQSMQSDYVHHLFLAASIGSISVVDRPAHRRGMVTADQRQWKT